MARKRKPKRLNEYEWRAAEKMWLEGVSYSQIAHKFGVSVSTVYENGRKRGWPSRAETEAASETGGPGVTFIPEVSSASADYPVADRDLATVEEELRDAQARIAELEDQVTAYKPTFDMTAKYADPVQWLTDLHGERFWTDLAHQQYATENKDRHRKMLPALTLDDALLASVIADLKAKEALWPNLPVTEPAGKKLKMVIVRNGIPTIEQIPMEPQINNMAGSLADGLVRYTDKGFKLMEPFGCPRAGCFQPAGLTSDGKWAFEGYCTEVHRQEIEGDQESAIPGVVTSGTAGAYRGA